MRPPTIPPHLLLTGLENLPALDARAEMTAFERLPGEVQRELRDCPFYFSARRVLAYHAAQGTDRTVWLVRQSIAVERRRFARERQETLDWARETFALEKKRKV